jgi:hypothetical protein
VSDFQRCPKCKQYGWVPCRCRPYQVYYPEYFGEEKEEVYGTSHESVVEAFAEKINEDEPRFEEDLFESPIEVTDSDGVMKRFNCTATLSVDYSAEEIEPKEDLDE